ncbi:MAG: twin-arginine translocation signal domain-containing protein, partial [Verrucomicrobiota bacterium]
MDMNRREFMQRVGATTAVAAAGVPLIGQACPVKTPETTVKLLYDSLTDRQKQQICFDWNHIDNKRGLLRTRIQNNWRITPHAINGKFYTSDQRAMIREIFLGLTDPGWHERFDKQLKDDLGGFGKKQSIAIFGEPGTDKFQFVLTSRHMTLRCDGNSAEHLAFGGPILYAHEGEKL